MVFVWFYLWWLVDGAMLFAKQLLKVSILILYKKDCVWGWFFLSFLKLCFSLPSFGLFFHSSVNPSIVIGGVWPPAYLTILDAWKVPFLNTIILLTSGCTITVAHHAIVYGSKYMAMNGLVATVILAAFFTKLQEIEYVTAPFSISDSVYGSCFFLCTGFHGFHVFVGTCFLIVCLFRLYINHFTREHHFGFEAAAWYWHFVDVVWLFLFVSIYWWGS